MCLIDLWPLIIFEVFCKHFSSEYNFLVSKSQLHSRKMNGILVEAVLLIVFYLSLSESNNVERQGFDFDKITNTSLSGRTFEKESVTSDFTKKFICFYVFTEAFSPKIMDGLCTHINVGFFGINKNDSTIEISEVQKQLLQEIALMKKMSPNLKILISIGGAGDDSFSSMIKNHITRKMFIRSFMKILKEFKIDGIDLDWEWPVVEDGNFKEKIKFVQLLREIREEFSRHKKVYILSADVPSLRALIELGYYVNYIAEEILADKLYFFSYVDYVNVMCYDYHFFTKLFPFTGHNAPLYSTKKSILSKDINQSISFWISKSMPREKIIVGIPTYGHTFQLVDVARHYLYSPAKGFGGVGQDGFADYQQICQFLKDENTSVVYDNISRVPYAYNSLEWISFDDEGSLTIKANYILSEKLGGAMIYSVNADDFNGTCHGIILPLIRKVRNILFNEV